jgi:hypothetical protein
MSNPDDQEERFGNLEKDVAVIAVKQDTQMEILTEMRATLNQQTQILQSFLVLEQKHVTLANEFSDLKKDYSGTKNEVVRAVSMMRGIVFAGAIFVSVIVGMGLYIYNDKIDMLNRHDEALRGFVSGLLEGGEKVAVTQ